MRITTGLMLVGLLAATGCARPSAPGGPAEADPEPPPDAALVSADYTGRFRTVGTVLESAEHGPPLCHGVDESLPPQCSGPDIVGWDWTTVPAESASGTTWGTYLLVGTFDGTRFSLTEPAVVDDGSTYPRTAADFSAPCDEPGGGWAPVDTERTTDATLQEAIGHAQADPGYAGLWVDQRGEGNNDPRQLVLVVRTTADPTALEDTVREVWGGALCVTTAAYTEAELLAAQQELTGEPGVVGSGPDVLANRLDVQVLVATQARQRDLDERFGTGMVRQEGLLEPLD